MRKQITIVTCDICQAETNNQSTDIMTIVEGSVSEYGRFTESTDPIIDRIDIRELDLCNGCYKKLLKYPLYVRFPSFMPAEYRFKGEKK